VLNTCFNNRFKTDPAENKLAQLKVKGKVVPVLNKAQHHEDVSLA